MWHLERKDGTPILMADGGRFTYTTDDTAKIGRRVLSKETGHPLVIVED